MFSAFKRLKETNDQGWKDNNEKFLKKFRYLNDLMQ